MSKEDKKMRNFVKHMIVVAIIVILAAIATPRVAMAGGGNLTPEQEQLLREYGGVDAPAAHPGPVSGVTTPTTPAPAPSSDGAGPFVQIGGGLLALVVGAILAIALCPPPFLWLGLGYGLDWAIEKLPGDWSGERFARVAFRWGAWLLIPVTLIVYVLGGLGLGGLGAAFGAMIGEFLGGIAGLLLALIPVPGILSCFTAMGVPVAVWVKRRRDAADDGSSSD